MNPAPPSELALHDAAVSPSSSASDTTMRAAAAARRSHFLSAAASAAPAVALGLGALALVRHNRALGAALFGGAVGFGLMRWQLQRLFAEQAGYTVESRTQGLELRRYPAMVCARTVLKGLAWEEALHEGFHRLAGYIFGDNESGSHIAMTAPVLSTTGETDVHDRTMEFVMPGDRPLHTLPRPRDERVVLCEEPAKRVAVLAFRGSYANGRPAEKREELLERVEAAGLEPKGRVTFAGYDPPSTLPALRRNEVMVEVHASRETT